MRRMMVRALPIALLFGLAMAPAAQAAPQDGNWSVLVVTEKGDCDRAYRYSASVANGRVSYAGDASVNMTGTVAPDGAVHVTIKLHDKGANGVGRLSGGAGAGTWHGTGPNASCSGHWEAEKR